MCIARYLMLNTGTSIKGVTMSVIKRPENCFLQTTGPENILTLLSATGVGINELDCNYFMVYFPTLELIGF